MGEVIDFITERSKRKAPIKDFKVRSKKDNDYLLANLNRILVDVPFYDTHNEDN